MPEGTAFTPVDMKVSSSEDTGDALGVRLVAPQAPAAASPPGG